MPTHLSGCKPGVQLVVPFASKPVITALAVVYAMELSSDMVDIHSVMVLREWRYRSLTALVVQLPFYFWDLGMIPWLHEVDTDYATFVLTNMLRHVSWDLNKQALQSLAMLNPDWERLMIPVLCSLVTDGVSIVTCVVHWINPLFVDLIYRLWCYKQTPVRPVGLATRPVSPRRSWSHRLPCNMFVPAAHPVSAHVSCRPFHLQHESHQVHHSRSLWSPLFLFLLFLLSLLLGNNPAC